MKKKIALLTCLLISSFSMANQININKAFSDNCSTYLNKEKRISTITLGEQDVNNKRAFFTITLRDGDTNTKEISVLESVGNDYGKAMFQLMNTAYLSNSNIKITGCLTNKISAASISYK
ncbi:hypothetical protein GKR56_16650 [Providencia alcalifaciens]|uniref:Uncharacterized protein n=1 Tax=Providencia alcalifaciens DSM 30120 TaxID=520999 RepID=B6XBA4_9GAMM|nr:hypothetical protein [Providencia alcalifaciens]ATG17829.1 hypothetical protein CO695_16535 [Providencia alcalifaciens]EEB47383.1 hypothetical protein PROVALCAL_00559 [Providencia alcalifaciens DSM 30120]MTC27759.1 hypothetical protein [Providencia alcalifaciens]MTC27766.1 hypothetical protein [Providencia alcalifaciens]MTC54853.1 hypothetical protein [Providencia alcalifaciens]